MVNEAFEDCGYTINCKIFYISCTKDNVLQNNLVLDASYYFRLTNTLKNFDSSFSKSTAQRLIIVKYFRSIQI